MIIKVKIRAIIVVIEFFFSIGFLGAPGSFPNYSTSFLTPKGSVIKKLTTIKYQINHKKIQQ